MTTTFTDPPGTRFKPHDTVHLTDDDITDITIRCALSTGVEEYVWRDGDFASGYRSSTFTPVGGGGNFELVRKRGWPAVFAITVFHPFPSIGGDVQLPFSGATKPVSFTPVTGQCARVDLATADVTAALPAASANTNLLIGLMVVAGGHTLTATVQTGEYLNGVLNGTRVYSTVGDGVTLQSDGTQWRIVHEIAGSDVIP